MNAVKRVIEKLLKSCGILGVHAENLDYDGLKKELETILELCSDAGEKIDYSQELSQLRDENKSLHAENDKLRALLGESGNA
jgi:regulator of replication initiation timing